MLDGVPLGCARGIVADGDGDTVPVAQLLLETEFPAPIGAAIAAAIGEDEQSGRLWIASCPVVTPPRLDAVHGELGGVA